MIFVWGLFHIWHFPQGLTQRTIYFSQSTTLKSYTKAISKHNLLVNNNFFIMITKVMFLSAFLPTAFFPVGDFLKIQYYYAIMLP